jgi:hypothetical protein
VSTRVKALFTVGLFALLGWLLWRATREPAVPHGGAAAARGAKKDTEAAFSREDVPTVAMVRPEPLPGETFDRGRVNLFTYERSPEEIAEEKRKAEEARRLAEEEAERQRVIREEQDRLRREQEAKDAERRRLEEEERRRNPPPPPPPKPPDFRYEYIGIIGPMGDPFAILSVGSGPWSYVKTGDVVDRQFVVEHVAEYVLNLSYVDALFAADLKQVPRSLPGASPTVGAPTSPGRSPSSRKPR